MNFQHFLFSIILMLAVLNPSFSQSKKNLVIQGGIGLLPTYFMDGGNSDIPPVQATVSYKFLDLVSVGAFGGFSKSKSAKKTNSDGSTYQYENKNTTFGIRAAVHSNRFENWDIYGGVNAGYNMPEVHPIVLQPGESQIPLTHEKDQFIYGGFVGFAGYLTPSLGLYAELGYGISLVQAGVSFRL